MFPRRGSAWGGPSLPTWRANTGPPRWGSPSAANFSPPPTPGKGARSGKRAGGEKGRYWRDWSSDVCSSDLQAGFDQVVGEWRQTPGVTVPGAPEYVPQTGYRVAGTFLPYWQANDGPRRLGYPISDEFYAPSILEYGA